MRLPSALFGVLAGASCAALIACAANSGAKAPSAAPSSVSGLTASSLSPHDQIQQLADRITTEANTLHLEPQHVGAMAPVPVAPMSSQADLTCHPAKTDTCSDTCTLADSICADAKQICDLAKQLPGDAWADGKCTSAADSCDAAHKRCCGCQ